MLVMGKLFYNGLLVQITVVARPTSGITGKLVQQGSIYIDNPITPAQIAKSIITNRNIFVNYLI